jgi:hypothetical protein
MFRANRKQQPPAPPAEPAAPESLSPAYAALVAAIERVSETEKQTRLAPTEQAVTQPMSATPSKRASSFAEGQRLERERRAAAIPNPSSRDVAGQNLAAAHAELPALRAEVLVEHGLGRARERVHVHQRGLELDAEIQGLIFFLQDVMPAGVMRIQDALDQRVVEPAGPWIQRSRFADWLRRLAQNPRARLDP